MRMMLKASFPIEASNKALHEGTFPGIMEKAMSRLQPEAAYFLTLHGRQ